MKKLIFTVLLASGVTFAANAGVTFLPNASGNVGTSVKNNQLSSEQKCKNAGYKQSNCPSSQKGISQCPYNNSYYKYCCPKEYQFTVKECVKNGLRASRNSCGGLYKCL
ncbi:MAG: hypothetical protein E7016_01915 [Alphaproteobacteria bacterium]|nr:hypothetical protein [Alphaproteobacteria bacterium]